MQPRLSNSKFLRTSKGRQASDFGIVNVVELVLKRAEQGNETDTVAAAQRAHEYRFPFEHLPGRPPQNKVLATVTDGRLAKVRDVELVWNDAKFLDWCFGKGYYKKVAPEIEKELLEVAVTAFAVHLRRSVN